MVPKLRSNDRHKVSPVLDAKFPKSLITAKDQRLNIKLRYFNDQPTASTDTAAHQAAVNATGKFSNFATNYEDYKNGAVERTIAGESQKNPYFKKYRAFSDLPHPALTPKPD